MNERSKSGLQILQAAILLGILCDVLLRHTPGGLNVSLVVSVLAAAMVMLLWRRKREFWSPASGGLICGDGALRIGIWRGGTRSNPKCWLRRNIHHSCGACVARVADRHPVRWRFHYAIGFFWSGVNAAFSPFSCAFNDIEWSAVSQEGWKKHFVSVPSRRPSPHLCYHFSALFRQADAFFGNRGTNAEHSGRSDPSARLYDRFLLVDRGHYLRGVITESLANDVKSTFLEKRKLRTHSERQRRPEESNAGGNQDRRKLNGTGANPKAIFFRRPTIGPIEVGVAMGLINLSFAFCDRSDPISLRRFELVQQTENMKLADYARRGFGELVTVAALVLPTLLFSHWLLRKESPPPRNYIA
ncbi:MAG: DUF4173 domain-containing protein [Acidobacteria bacterium]|nr:DUF4173 domain-containing protein [Acidobacteriota bacterium]